MSRIKTFDDRELNLCIFDLSGCTLFGRHIAFSVIQPQTATRVQTSAISGLNQRYGIILLIHITVELQSPQVISKLELEVFYLNALIRLDLTGHIYLCL